jgi:hypothetical protein
MRRDDENKETGDRSQETGEKKQEERGIQKNNCL